MAAATSHPPPPPGRALRVAVCVAVSAVLAVALTCVGTLREEGVGPVRGFRGVGGQRVRGPKLAPAGGPERTGPTAGRAGGAGKAEAAHSHVLPSRCAVAPSPPPSSSHLLHPLPPRLSPQFLAKVVGWST